MASTKATVPTEKTRPRAKKAKRAIKFTVEMRQRIVDSVLQADKAGLSRTSVFNSLAVEWSTARRYKYSQHQVSSQFHLHKAELGYDKLSEPAYSSGVRPGPTEGAPRLGYKAELGLN